MPNQLMPDTASPTQEVNLQQVRPQLIDASGLACPLPLLKLKKALHQAISQQHILLIATDKNSQTDIKRFCEISGNKLVAFSSHSDKYEFVIEKK